MVNHYMGLLKRWTPSPSISDYLRPSNPAPQKIFNFVMSVVKVSNDIKGYQGYLGKFTPPKKQVVGNLGVITMLGGHSCHYLVKYGLNKWGDGCTCWTTKPCLIWCCFQPQSVEQVSKGSILRFAQSPIHRSVINRCSIDHLGGNSSILLGYLLSMET